MACIIPRKNKLGETTAYRIMVCTGRDDRHKQIWRTCTVRRPQGLSKDAEKKEITRLALEFEHQCRTDADRGVPDDKDKVTLAQFIKTWTDEHVENGKHSPNGKRFFAYTCGIILVYYGDKTRLAEINPRSIVKFLKILRTDRKLAESTQQHCLGTLKNILNYAVRCGYLDRNPVDLLKNCDKPELPPKKIDYMTADKAQAFITALADEPAIWRTFFTTLLYTGMRRGECLALTWKDYDTERQELHVCKTVSIAEAGAKTKTIIKTTKTGHDRYVPVIPDLQEVLEEWRRESERDFGCVEPDAYIFPARHSTKAPMYPTSPSCWLSRFEKRHGLDSYSPHDLRHTAATLSRESGADIKQIAKLLGHQNTQVTYKFYVEADEEQTRRAAEGLGKLLNNTKNTPKDGE